MKITWFLVLFIALCSVSFAAWPDAAYLEKQNLIYASIDRSPLKSEQPRILYIFHQKPESNDYLLTIRCEGHEERSKPKELDAFKAAITQVAERLSVKLKDRILPISSAEIVSGERDVCVGMMFTRYDLVADIPLRFKK